jgi:alkaline phosphatase D
MPLHLTRRRFLSSTAAAGASIAASGLVFPAVSRAADRPVITHGLQSGDVDTRSGMIWARADRPSRVMFEVATTDSFKNARTLPSLNALPESDYAVKFLLEDLPSDQDIFYRTTLASLDDLKATSEPMVGHFRTAPASRRNIRFSWSGDTAGQGWGIDTAGEGMKTYASMAKHDLDFFLHSGDTVYSDGPILAEQAIPTGGVWKNIVAEGVDKVAESLDEFRGRWKYNLMDRNMRDFNARVPTFFQWDDHEVLNNWSPSKDLSADDRYKVKSVALLSARAGRAFHEMTSIRYTPAEPGRVYRTVHYGPLLDVFFLDMRSYRAGNGTNVEPSPSSATAFIGQTQIAWLKRELAASRATWKVIAADMPIGLVVPDGNNFEAIANANNGAPLGREFEIVDLLRFIKNANISNTVWLTADVHYAAAHYYNPDKAAFQDFNPFWEFVSGPLHAGTFGPNNLDMTFGPELKFIKTPPMGQANLPPSAGLQFFGIVEIDGPSEVMTVRLMNRDDQELFRQVLEPVRIS